jgi:hypothetical protein
MGVGVGAGGAVGTAGDGLGLGPGWNGLGMLDPPPPVHAATPRQSKQATKMADVVGLIEETFTIIRQDMLG